MAKQGKIWGETEKVFNNGIVSVHFLNIMKGGYCSEHRHQQKTNKFYVISGELEISIWTEEGMIDRTILKAGQSTIIPINVYHKFQALTDVECIEIYEVRFHNEDIERRTTGGLVR
jgi:quercetin dioxygenase-like cupin family protein